MVQLLTLYTDPGRHNKQRYRGTDRRHYDANSRSYCVRLKLVKQNNKKWELAAEWIGKLIPKTSYGSQVERVIYEDWKVCSKPQQLELSSFFKNLSSVSRTKATTPAVSLHYSV